MFTQKRLSFILIMLAGFTLILAACQSVPSANSVADYGKGMGMTMGRGRGMGMQSMGMQSMGMGNMQEAAMHAEMLSQAVEQEVITEEEVFELVHKAVSGNHAGGMMNGMGGGMGHQMGGGMGMVGNMNMTEILASLVESGTLTQEQVDAFLDIHTRLKEAGLMK